MKIIKTVGWLVLVFAVGVGGVMVGSRMRERSAPVTPVAAIPAEWAGRNLPLGGDWPDVPLLAAAGDTVGSAAVVAGGGVLLFIDPGCDPCHMVLQRWQEAVDDGLIAAQRVAALSYAPTEMNEALREDLGVAIPVYRDFGLVFRHEYGIERFPLAVIVGQSGRIRSKSFDSISPIDPAELARQLER